MIAFNTCNKTSVHVVLLLQVLKSDKRYTKHSRTFIRY